MLQSTIRLCVMMALCVLMLLPFPSRATDANEDFVYLSRLVGKTYASKELNNRITRYSDGRIRIGTSSSVFLIGVEKDRLNAKTSVQGTLLRDAEITLGKHGFWIRTPLNTYTNDDYFLFDSQGDLHRFSTWTKRGVTRFNYYAKLVDVAGPNGGQAKQSSILGEKELSQAVEIAGMPIDQFYKLIAREESFTPGSRQGSPPLAVSPATIAAAPPAKPSQNVVSSADIVEAVDAKPQIAGNKPRIALVVGNAAYDARLGPLANAVNDANAITAALRNAGFQVVQVNNVDQKSMKRAIVGFGQKLSAAGPGVTALFYYAGHGIQSRGINYLAPIGAAIQTEADVDIEAVAADTVLRQMEEAGAATNIVILDACRNLPVQRSFRSASRGLARMDAPNGSFVAYSTAPGSVAADGEGQNSPFAAALVAEMKKPGQSIEITFRNVRRNVLTATNGKQTPWDSSSLIDDFVFVREK